MQNKSYKYKFSIIMAVYNVEMFLEEAIDSIIQQDIGFEENVQLILVDDGSKDSSGAICDRYLKKYPSNIVVIHKENEGVSRARNDGFGRIEGEYVNCVDSDDKISLNTLSLVYKRFKEWENQVDLVTIPLRFFDGQKGDHILNYKFDDGARIIDLNEEYDKPLLSMSCSFIKNEVVAKYRFDEKLAYAEDAKIVIQVLMEKMKYGVVPEACYWYRKRTIGAASAIQSSLNNKKWYLDYMKYFALWTVNNSRAKNQGVVPLFVQYTLMYDLQWRFNSEKSPEMVMNEEECTEYFEVLRQVLSHIENKVIMQQKQMTAEYRLYAVQFKYDTGFEEKNVENDIEYFCSNDRILLESDLETKVEFIDINDKTMELEGAMVFPAYRTKDIIDIYIYVNGKEYLCENVKRDNVSISMGNVIAYAKGFKCCFEVNPQETYEIRLGCKINGQYVEKKNIQYGKFSPLQNHMWNSYYVRKPYILTYSKNIMCLKPYSSAKHFYRELSFLKGLIKLKSRPAYKAVVMRVLYHLYQLFPHKEIWLLSDRIDKADDNGEALFYYLNQHKPKDIRYYFAISKESPDYDRLKENGKVIEFLGWKYKWLCLCGAKVVSSQGEDYVYRPFASYSYCYADLMKNVRFAFLQHGVIKDDLSRWLKRYNKNIHMFVTTTKPEYNSIINGNYGYDAKVVKMTGLPRHDRLYHDEKKYITIMPSWRAYLVGDTDVHTGKRIPQEGFSKSQYCKMYSELFTNKELLSYAKEHGYTIRFMSHPNMSTCTEMMTIDPEVEIMSGEDIMYRQIFAESNLVVTDYSSVVFDFAYLRKPVLYFQADQEEFFNGSHTYDKGYFEYERDGFGEVAYDVESLVTLIREYIDSNCKLKEKFAVRIDETFPYSDKENSKRVYEAVRSLT